MTRPSSASAPDDLFDAIAKLLEPGQREYFYQRMLYFRQLRPEDELLRLVEAIGLLALLIRDAPHAMAVEREQLAQLLEAGLATIHATGEAWQAYQQQLEDRLTRLPADLAHGISPDAIARAIVESLRQQFMQSGVPATADALTAISKQLTQATGQFQRAAEQLRACTGIAEQARGAMDHMSTSLSKATHSAQRAVAELTHQLRVEYTRAVWLLCGAAWLFGDPRGHGVRALERRQDTGRAAGHRGTGTSACAIFVSGVHPEEAGARDATRSAPRVARAERPCERASTWNSHGTGLEQ